MRKSIKIFFHHNISQDVNFKAKKSWLDFLFTPFIWVFNAFYYISLFFGKTLVVIFTSPILVINFISQIPGKFTANFESIKNQKKYFAFKFLGFLLIAILSLSPIFVFRIGFQGKQLVGKVLGVKDEALSDIHGLQQSINDQNFEAANLKLEDLLNQLQNIQTQIDQAGTGLNTILKVIPNNVDATNILKASQKFISCSQNLLTSWQKLSNIKISTDGFYTQEGVNNTLNEVSNKLSDAVHQYNEANDLLSSFDQNLLPDNYKEILTKIKSLSSNFITPIAKLNDATKLLSVIFNGEKNILIVFQNNNELRPTGGFMGTVGTMKLSNGKIAKLDIRSVYDYDGQLKEKLLPPLPLTTASSSWYLRDTNWFAEFNDSAPIISQLYEKSGGETPDLVLSVTPNLIIDLLKITGPINLPTYNIKVDADNFIETIQTSTSIYYDKDLNQPKQILADLYPALMQKLSSFNQDNQLKLVAVLEKHLVNGDVLMYSRDFQLENLIHSLHWGGEWTSYGKDFLSINSANIGGTKTDRYIKRSLFIETNISHGKVLNKLSYKVANPLPSNDKLFNKSFVRFFVPQGARLLNAGGFSTPPTLPTINARALDLVNQWNGQLKYSNDQQNAFIGVESDKTFFAGFIELKTGEEKTISIEYELPFRLSSVDSYSLAIQKQPGMMPFEVKQNISTTQNIAWSNSEQSKSWSENLDNYLFHAIVFK